MARPSEDRLEESSLGGRRIVESHMQVRLDCSWVFGVAEVSIDRIDQEEVDLCPTIPKLV